MATAKLKRNILLSAFGSKNTKLIESHKTIPPETPIYKEESGEKIESCCRR